VVSWLSGEAWGCAGLADGAGLDGTGLDGTGLDGAGLDGAGLDGAGLEGAGPGGAAVAGAALPLGALPPSAGDDRGWEPGNWPDRPTITRPMTTSSPSDVRDLLPPVSPGNGADLALWGGQAAGAGQAGGAGLAGRADPFGSGLPGEPAARAPGEPWSGPRQDGAGRTVGPVSAWSPLVIASVAMIVAVSVMAPIIGTAIALAVLVALRAVATTGRQLAKRRSADGGGGGLPLLAVALYPLAALRAVFGLLLVAPVALLAFCVAAAAAIIAIPVHPLPQAVALGAGALVAVVGLGPGSSGSRSALASVYTAAARSASLLAVAYVGVLAVAVWAGLTAWYQSPAPAYWPINSVHTQLLHLPTIHAMLTDVRHNLLNLAHQIGL